MKITTISGITTVDGQRITPTELQSIERMVERRELLRFEYGSVIWYETVKDTNRHMLKPTKQSTPPKVETRGRPRGENYGKHCKNPGVGRGGAQKKDIPLEVVLELKAQGLSGREVAKEIERLGYGVVHRNYANLKARQYRL